MRQLVAIVVSVAALAATVFVAFRATSHMVPTLGGAYIEGVGGSPTAIDPLFASLNDVDKDIVSLIYSGLTRLGKQGEIVPDLAQSWDISPDGLIYTFRLRDGVKWHDGAPFTADDVVFTIKAIQDPDFQGLPDLANLWKGVLVQSKDPLTVSFNLPRPFAPFLSYTTIGILPKHLLAGVKAADMPIHSINGNPVGTGPFRFKNATIENLVLEKNPTYFGGSTFLDQVEFKFFPDYQSALVALNKGDVNGVFLRPGASAEELGKLKEANRFSLEQAERTAYSMVFLNNKRPLFADKRVRQAMLYALDRDDIIKTVLAGQGVRADSPVLPKTWAYDGQVKQYAYNQEKARALFKEAGWQVGASGVLEKDSQQFRFNLLTNDDPLRIAVGQAVARQLAAIGIRAELSASGSTGLLQTYLIPRNYDAILFGWEAGYDPDSYSIWHSSQITEDGLNIASYSSPDADKLLDEAQKTSDMGRRKELYAKFQELFADDVPSILLYYPMYTYVQDKKVKGVQLGVMFEPSSRFYNINRWYVNMKRTWLPQSR
ncbi:MAG: peptide ABC transporter substrate-binding protein [Chloroflexi bacterium]|nr:peptide ABC transporter substrate-binding protein [Chloroflexota bacterium]